MSGAATTRSNGLLGALGRVLGVMWPTVLLLVGWWAWVYLNGYTALVAPMPLDVADDVVANPGAYLGPLAITAATAAAGLVLGTVGGVVLAVLIWLSPLLTAIVMPTAVLLRSVPVIAIVPVMIGVLGTGKLAVVAITAIVTFFPAFSLVGTALRSPAPASRDLFSVLGASMSAVLRRLLLPSAVPNLLVAIRLAAPSTILSAMLAEFLIGKSGLGYLFVESMAYAQFARAWGAALVATGLAVLAYLAANRLERWALQKVT